jgi:hypothetical protein
MGGWCAFRSAIQALDGCDDETSAIRYRTDGIGGGLAGGDRSNADLRGAGVLAVGGGR